MPKYKTTDTLSGLCLHLPGCKVGTADMLTGATEAAGVVRRTGTASQGFVAVDWTGVGPDGVIDRWDGGSGEEICA